MPVWRITTKDSEYFGLERDGKGVIVGNDGVVLSEVSSASEAAFETFYPGAEVAKCNLMPGEHHPRIWRPGAPRPELVYEREWAASVQAAQNLFGHMAEVFRFVEPSEANWTAYGHEIRELLMLAAMEVESGWKAVLRANGYPVQGGRNWNRNDYVKLVGPMRLDEWEVRIVSHPEAGKVRPFEGWKANRGGLPWYDAYNAVKHDREAAADRGSLRHCVDAVAGVFVMVCAQFGYWAEVGGAGELSLAHYQSVIPRELVAVQKLRLTAEPKFGGGEKYVPPAVGGVAGWTPKNLLF